MLSRGPERGDVGTGLSEAEDIVNEEQHVLLLHVTEVFRHRQCRQRNPQTRARRIIHLAKDQPRFIEHPRLFHLVDKVISLTSTLAHTGKPRDTTVVLCNTLDHLLDKNGLANTSTTEQTNLETMHIRGEQVNRLNTGLKQLRL